MLTQSDFARIYALVNECEPELATRFFDEFRSVEQEREACAQIAEQSSIMQPYLLQSPVSSEQGNAVIREATRSLSLQIAAAIRARQR